MKTILEMAREAGFNTNHDMIWINKWEVSPYMQRFAALVLANNPPDSSMAWQEGNEAGRLSERESCAQLCEDEICNCCWDEEAGAVAEHLAAAIRARGNT